MKSYWIRVVNVVAIVVLLLGYNQVLTQREQREQIAQMQAELTSTTLAMEQLVSEIKEATAGLQTEAGDTSGEDQQEAGEAGGGLYTDGVYEGSAQGFGGLVTVSVTVTGDVIESIEIVDASGEDGTFLDMAKDVIPAMLSAQSTEVDTISGATFSSTGIINATALALEEAAG